MACDVCPNHNFGAGRLPTGNDDPCNTSGEGEFCPGSYWYYDASTAGGADLIAGGDCDRLFQRIGEDCGVDQWLEIPLRDTQYSGDAPTVADCCPAGTLWIRPGATSGLAWDEVYMSYADFTTDPPTCNWCLVCTTEPVGGPVVPATLSVVAHAVSPTQIYDDFDGNPATDFPAAISTTTGLAPVQATITNPDLTRSMTVKIDWGGYTGDLEYQSTNGIDLIHSIQPYFYIDGVLQNNPFATDILVNRVGGNETSLGVSTSTGNWTQTVTIPPGGTVTASMDASFTNQLDHNANITATVHIEQGTISMQGVLV